MSADGEPTEPSAPRRSAVRSTYVRVAIVLVLILVARQAVRAVTDTPAPAPVPGATGTGAGGSAAREATRDLPIPQAEVVRDYDAGGGPDAPFTDVTESAGTGFDHVARRVTTTRVTASQLVGMVGTDKPTDSQVQDWLQANVTPFLVEHASLRYYGIGQAWGDYDGDGHPDLYLTSQIGPNALFHNKGDGTFERSSAAADVALAEQPSGGAGFIDYDNDGWLDLLVLGDGTLSLFHNDDGTGFTDRTEASGLTAGGQGETATWGDLDNDGDLDLYIANYGCQPCNEAPPAPEARRDQDQLFRNDGDGTFTDLTEVLEEFPATKGLAFSAGWFDYDDDGRLDLYVANDVRDDKADGEKSVGGGGGDGSTPGNVLLRNTGPGCGGWCFEDVTKATGTDVRADAMGLSIGDVDGNGTPDLFFTNGGWRAGPTTLLTNDGDGTFTNASEALGANLGEWSWGNNFLDVDNDGRLDIYVATWLSELTMQGHVGDLPSNVFEQDPAPIRADVRNGTIGAVYDGKPPPYPVVASVAPRTDNDRLLHQQPDGTFREIVLGPTDRFSGPTLGSATGDYDGDGRADVVVGNIDSGFRLLRNTFPEGTPNHRLGLRLTGDGKEINRFGVGARVSVRTSDGRTLTGWVQNGGSLGAGNDAELLFGLGDATATSVDITWPGGSTTTSAGSWSDQRITVDSTGAVRASSPMKP